MHKPYAAANVRTLMRTPRTSMILDAQETIVAPVVSTSSTNRICFP